MKNQGILQLILITTVILIGFNSCTVKKRLYQPGYHVEWHNSNKKHKTQQESEKHIHHNNGDNQVAAYQNPDDASYKTKPIEIPQESESSYASSDDNMDNLEIIRSSKEKPSFFAENTQATPDTNKYVVDKDNPDTVNSSEIKPKMHWAAITGFTLSIIGLLSIFLFFLFSWALPIAILATIFSRIGMKRIKANPEIYNGDSLAKAGFILGIIGIIISLLLSAFYIALILFAIMG